LPLRTLLENKAASFCPITEQGTKPSTATRGGLRTHAIALVK